MPHIIAEGCHMDRQVSRINIHAEVWFSREAWRNQVKVNARMEEIRERIEKMLEEYFEMSEITSEEYSNHEYNTRISNY